VVCSACFAASRLLVHAQSPSFGVGRAPSADELKAIDIDVLPDGRGLPTGSGTAREGKDVYTNRCATCHGPSLPVGPWHVAQRFV